MTKIKKAMACLIAVTTLAVGMGSFTASAAINWTTATSGIKTTYTGTSDVSIEGNNQSYTASKIHSTFTHTGSSTLLVWNATGVNQTSATKYMGCSTQLRNYKTGALITSASNYNSGDTSAHSGRVASSNYNKSSLPASYTLEYDTYIAGGNSQYAGIVEEIEFRETILEE